MTDANHHASDEQGPSTGDGRGALRTGAALFDDGEAHAAHEIFEQRWILAKRAERTAEAAFWQGLVLCCGAVHHAGRANAVGARALSARAERYLGTALEAAGTEGPGTKSSSTRDASNEDSGTESTSTPVTSTAVTGAADTGSRSAGHADPVARDAATDGPWWRAGCAWWLEAWSAADPATPPPMAQLVARTGSSDGEPSA